MSVTTSAGDSSFLLSPAPNAFPVFASTSTCGHTASLHSPSRSPPSAKHLQSAPTYTFRLHKLTC